MFISLYYHRLSTPLGKDIKILWLGKKKKDHLLQSTTRAIITSQDVKLAHVNYTLDTLCSSEPGGQGVPSLYPADSGEGEGAR